MSALREETINLLPSAWPAGEYDHYMRAQSIQREKAGAASGRQGAVTVSYGAFAARAGLEALKQGGSAIDAALTTAMAQIVLTAGAPISFFGILSLVHYDAKTGKVSTMNAEWNTVQAEADPLSIPGGISFANTESLKGSAVSGRSALVGGFMKGVEAAHRRFGRLPFASIFSPSIELAERGMPVTALLAHQFDFRAPDFRRLKETRETFLKPDGSTYREGEIFRQPRLAETLRSVAKNGTDHMYNGPWGAKLVAAVQADGGKMTAKDLQDYQVAWADALVADLGDDYAVCTSPAPNVGGIGLIEAQNLAIVSGLTKGEHWTKSPDALRKAVDITQQFMASFMPASVLSQMYPDLDFSPQSRITRAHAEKLWSRMEQGVKFGRYKRTSPMHSDDVVAIDGDGNIAAITHSINSVYWGKTAIVIDGISIGDPAAFQQAQLATVKPGERLPAPTETGVVLKKGKPVLGFASMGAGLHHRTFQCLLDVMHFGMSVDEAINTPDFYMPETDLATGELTVTVGDNNPIDDGVLAGTGYAWREVPMSQARLGGAGDWVAISRNPETGELRAASTNRNNSDAVAY
jgi:gamma-glutamyltranspeptidase/glutathione hydrolase